MSASAREVLILAWKLRYPQMDAEKEVEALLEFLPSAGFVVVPREPTEEMVSALWNALENDIPHTVTFRAALKVALSASLTRSRAPSPSQPL